MIKSDLKFKILNPISSIRKVVLASLILMLVSFESDRAISKNGEKRLSNNQFTFVRIKYTPNRMIAAYEPPWAHDYPRAERHLSKALREFTQVDCSDEGVILTLDDPELFNYPLAYICEVGFFTPTEQEIANLREYLYRGGLLIVDDFDGTWSWYNFLEQLRRIFPDRSVEELPPEHPIFHSFFDIDDINFVSYRGQGKILGIKDDKGRLMMIINWNYDVGEYWEWADTPYMPVRDMNEAFKLGVNFVIYAMTH